MKGRITASIFPSPVSVQSINFIKVNYYMSCCFTPPYINGTPMLFVSYAQETAALRVATTAVFAFFYKSLFALESFRMGDNSIFKSTIGESLREIIVVHLCLWHFHVHYICTSREFDYG